MSIPAVSFVSAGPGDPDLLTIRARDRLAAADVVLHDDVMGGAVLGVVRPDADLVAVGKRAGRASPRQNHVTALLVAYAQTGQRIVRLKGGDGGLFGRLEEEMDALDAAGIAYEVIPGVTAAAAAAAAARMPLTRREHARRVQFVTGHDVTGALPAGLNLAALADPHATTVVYMGRRTFAGLAARLIAAGLPPETPALLAEAVTLPGQRLTRGTVAGLAAQLAAHPGDAPAVILYGPLRKAPP